MEVVSYVDVIEEIDLTSVQEIDGVLNEMIYLYNHPKSTGRILNSILEGLKFLVDTTAIEMVDNPTVRQTLSSKVQNLFEKLGIETYLISGHIITKHI